MNLDMGRVGLGPCSTKLRRLTMNEEPRLSLLERALRRLGLRRRPPRSRHDPPADSFVREPRRPKPSVSGGAATLELPDDDGPTDER